MAGADSYVGGGGNDWELVSLTASTYAATPGPALPLLPLDPHKKKTELPPAAAAPAIFMSQHFNLPPAEAHAIILNGCPSTSILNGAMPDGEGDTDDLLNIPCQQSARETKTQGDSPTRCSDSHKNLSATLGLEVTTADSSAGAGNALDIPVCLPGAGEEERQATIVVVHAAQPDEYAGSDSTSVVHQVSVGSDNTIAVDSASRVAPNKNGPSSSSEIPPREGRAWWNRTFSFLRSNSKESLTFRFIFVAATVVGQRDRLHLRLEFNVDGEKISCAVREPIGQVKLNMLVGGSPVGVTN